MDNANYGTPFGAPKGQQQQQNKQQVGKHHQPVQLKRSLGLMNGVAIIVGVIVGSGIFVSPTSVLRETGSIGASLVVWSLCGLMAMLGALCFAELGTSIPTSGGEYTYIGLAYGPMLSFSYIWVQVAVITPCGNAIGALTFANYVLQPLYTGDCKPPEHATRLVALGILLILIYINCISVDSSIKLQTSFTLTKVLALLMIIVYGAYYLLAGKAVKFELPDESLWSGTQTSVSHLAQAFYAGFYTYSGWSALNCVTEEMKNPVKNMPRAIILSIASITLIYICTNVAYFAVLTKTEILSTDAIAVLFGQRTLVSFAQWLMPLLVALSTMSGLNAGIFYSSRVFLVGSRQGQLFSALRMINMDHLTPVPSLLFLGLISSLYLFTTDVSRLINYMGFVEALFAALAVSTVLALRLKMPNLPRPLRISALIPIGYLIFSLLLLVLPVWSQPWETLIGVLICLASIPIYFLTAHWKVKPRGYQSVLDAFNGFVQKLTLSVAPDLEAPLEAAAQCNGKANGEANGKANGVAAAAEDGKSAT